MSVQRLIGMFIVVENGKPQITEKIFFIGIAKMEYITGDFFLEFNNRTFGQSL